MAQVKLAPDEQARLCIDPMENILIGSSNIMRYMGIASIATLYAYVELYGFPAIKRPDGLWMTSMTSIDQWIFMGAELDAQNRTQSRGFSQRLDIAKARIEARLEAQAEGTASSRGGATPTSARSAQLFDEKTRGNPHRAEAEAVAAKYPHAGKPRVPHDNEKQNERRRKRTEAIKNSPNAFGRPIETHKLPGED